LQKFFASEVVNFIFLDMVIKVVHKLLHRYLSKWSILTMDVVIATLASALSLGTVALWHRDLFKSTSVPISWCGAAIVIAALCFVVWRTYLCIIRHTTLREVGIILWATLTKEVGMATVFLTFPWLSGVRQLDGASLTLLFTLDTALTFLGCIAARLVMIVLYNQIRSRLQGDGRKKVLIYDVDDKSVALVKRLNQSSHYDIVGFLSRNHQSNGQIISGVKVYNCETIDDFTDLVKSRFFEGVIFSREEMAREAQRNGTLKVLTDNGVKILLAPSIDEVAGGKLMRNLVREIKIEDLLGRPEIEISLDNIIEQFNDKTILVTGAAGSIGSELTRQLAQFGVKKLILFDNAESPTHNIRLELEERWPSLDFVPVIGDVRSTERLDFVFRKYHPQIVFHAAAYKHVPLMEENPCEAVLVNVGGSRNVADKCLEYGVEKMVMISTDKAVNPTNVMGCTKRLAEIYVQSLGVALEKGEIKGNTRFVTTRFGNVLGSNGSVIPRFREQIAKGGPVTVTHPEITRFFMTIPEACRLVMEAAVMSTGTQIFVFDMGEPVKIVNLAQRMIELAGLTPGKDIPIEFTGLRPGEKLYEEVLSNAENTLPTSHRRIRIARVREYSYKAALEAADKLTDLGMKVEIDEMIMCMKDVVPEFISQNSRYSKFDKIKALANG